MNMRRRRELMRMAQLAQAMRRRQMDSDNRKRRQRVVTSESPSPGGGHSAVSTVPFQSVNSDGWRLTYASPPTFTPDSSPETFQVSRQGYDTTGLATTYTDTFTYTERTRQPYPNQASLTTDQVAIDDYLYSTDSVSGATNNSAETSPKPVANWAMFDRRVIGNTLDVELVAFHRDARNGEQVACVEFRVSDGTNTVTAKVSSSSISTRYSSIGQKVIVYAASIDVSALANPATLTVNAKVYPWIGAAASVLDSADQSVAREFSPRYFRRDTSLLAAPRVAYVRTTGNDGTGVVSTTPATASANPFLTVLAAINAHHTAGGMDGAIIYIGDDGGTPFVLGGTASTRTQSHSELIITRESGVARANARVSYGAGSWRPRLGAAGGWVRFYDVGVVRDGTQAITGEATSNLAVVLDDVDYAGGSHSSALVNSNCTAWFGGIVGSALGVSAFNSSATYHIRCIRNTTFTVPTGLEGFLLLGCTLTVSGGAINHGGSATTGSICAYNRINSPSSSSSALNIGADTVGLAIVQNVFEYTSATAGASVRISADSYSNSTSHIILHHNTFVGFHNNGRVNLFYDEGPTPRTNKTMSSKGNIHCSINNKGDVFQADGTRVGNWPYLYGVGCRGEFSMFVDANGDGLGGAFAQNYPGLNASIGTSQTVRNDPLFTNYQGTTSGPTVGAGGGTYTIHDGSPCEARLDRPVLKYDLLGNARSLIAASSGAYEPVASQAFQFSPENASSGVWDDTSLNYSMLPLLPTALAGSGAPTVSGGKVTFDGVNDALVLSHPFSSRTTLPDASGATAGKGFTCTGLACDASTSTLWWGNAANNDGVAPSLVSTDLNGTQISEILLKPIYPSIGSVQGVAFDTSDGTLWFASYSENKIHHLTTSGVHIESITTGTNPNGLAYDPVSDHVIVMLADGTVTRYSCSTLTSVSTLASLTYFGATADQLFYDRSMGLLYASGGLNGQTGALAVLTTNGWSIVGHTEDASAIEGIYYNGSDLSLANDAYFHTTGNLLNQLVKYENPPFMKTCRTVDFVIVFKQNATQAKTVRVCSVGDGVDTQGSGLFIPSSTPTTLRVFANTDGNTTAKRAFSDVTVAALTTKSVIRVRVNLSTGLATVSQNGTVITSSASLAGAVGDMHRCAFAIGGYDHLAADRYGNLDVWDCYVAYDQAEAAAIAIESTFKTTHSL